MESQWIPNGFPNLQRAIAGGQKSLDSKNYYIIGKLLKRRCLKLACMTHLGTYNISYGQKKRWESN
jgi:hypothetical protein